MINKIIKRLEKRKDRWTDLANQSNFDGYAQEEKEYLLMANEDEKLIEIVQEVAKEYDWIPVEVAMPTEEGWYRVTCDNKKYWKTPMVRDLYYYPWIKCFVDNIRRSEHPYKDIKTFDWTEDVTAWKPVEAPYQKGE